MLGFNRQGDAQAGDFNGTGSGTLEATFGSFVTTPVGKAAVTGTVGASPRDLILGIGALVVLLAIAHKRWL
jgi:hypothetical protein